MQGLNKIVEEWVISRHGNLPSGQGAPTTEELEMYTLTNTLGEVISERNLLRDQVAYLRGELAKMEQALKCWYCGSTGNVTIKVVCSDCVGKGISL